MANLSTTKTPMPEQKPEERIQNFKEVALGYTEEMAKEFISKTREHLANI